MMPLMPLNADLALKILLPLTKIDKFHATNVQLVGLPKRAAPNVPIAHRANLKTLSTTKKFAPTAPLALRKVTRTKKVVRNVFKEKKHQRAEVVFVRVAIWVNSIPLPVKIVWRARKVFTKTPLVTFKMKEDKIGVNYAAMEKSPTKI